MTITLDNFDQKAATAFDGYLVRKDLGSEIPRQYPRADIRRGVLVGPLLRKCQ